MKKLKLIVFLFMMFFPFIIYAETCDMDNIEISSITLENKSENVIELDPASASGRNINLNLSMFELGDNIVYKIIVTNDSDDDYELDKNSFNLSSDYIDYIITFDDESNIVNANSSKIIYLKVEYKNKVPDEVFERGSFISNQSGIIQLLNDDEIIPEDTTINPNTGNNGLYLFLLILVFSGIVIIILKKKINAKFMILIIGIGIIIPICVYALCKCEINIASNVKIYKNYYKCNYDGEIIPGTEYTNGQYTYRYKKSYDIVEGNLTTVDMEEDGWSVILSDPDSSDDVNSKICTKINGIPVIDSSYMFYQSNAQNIDVSSFNTSYIIRMKGMFMSSQANDLDLSDFDTSNVTTMSRMFMGSAAKTVDMSGFDTQNLTNMSYMFRNSNIEQIDLKNFDTSKVTTFYHTFYSAKATVIDVSTLDTRSAENMSDMFRGVKIAELDVSSFDTSNVTDFGHMFQTSNIPAIDLSNFNTSNATTMRSMFYSSKFEKLDLSNFNTSNVIDMSHMFRENNLVELKGLEKFDTSKVTNMNWMFGGKTTKLTPLDLSSFDTSLVTNTNNMFYNNISVTTVYARTEADKEKLSASTPKPDTIVFTVKE
jgi:surface protein